MDTQEVEACTMVSQLLGPEYIRLLYFLPDSFFRLPFEQKQDGWKKILSAINRGEKNPERLAELA
jgi:hypothetical protein